MKLFDLSGPEFLVAFATIVAVLVVGAHVLLRVLESGGAPPPLLREDPYTIAYLRGGAREVLRVATLSLIDRGLLVVTGRELGWRTPGEAPPLTHAIEQLVVQACAKPCSFASISSTSHRSFVELRMQDPLRAQGLLVGYKAALARTLVFVMVVAVLWGVAGYKLALAAQRGRHNVELLWMFAIGATLLAARVVFRRRTARADRVIVAMKQLFAGLRQRSTTLHAGKDPVEILRLAAVFGVGAVPLTVFAHREVLGTELKARSARSSSACGSACGSSCGSSCGGGCGGGCGGCGS